MQPTSARPLPYVAGLASIADRYDGFILDLWGCVHDGIRPYPGAVDCMRRLKAAGKRLCLLSNAPRRVASVEKRLRDMDVPRDCYDEVLSSGEAAHRALAERTDPWHARLGRRCYHLGPERDNDVRDGVGLEIVDHPDKADFVLCTGIDERDETVADHEWELQAAAARKLPLICANPDLVVVVGRELSVCAGLLAQRYEALGGDVYYHGKPHAPVYATCFGLLGLAEGARVVAIGDSLRTDVAGAVAAGIDSLLIADGIHAEEFGMAPGGHPDMARIADAAAREGVRPTAVIPALVW